LTRPETLVESRYAWNLLNIGIVTALLYRLRARAALAR